MIGAKIIISAIMICLAIGLIKCFLHHKIKSGVALILFGCFVIYMFNHPTEFDNIGKELNSWVWGSNSVVKTEFFKNVNTNSDYNKKNNNSNFNNNSNENLGKVE